MRTCRRWSLRLAPKPLPIVLEIDVLGVAVEGAHQRRGRRVEHVVAHHRSDRLVHVDDVEAARRAARGAAW